MKRINKIHSVLADARSFDVKFIPGYFFHRRNRSIRFTSNVRWCVMLLCYFLQCQQHSTLKNISAVHFHLFRRKLKGEHCTFLFTCRSCVCVLQRTVVLGLRYERLLLFISLKNHNFFFMKASVK